MRKEMSNSMDRKRYLLHQYISFSICLGGHHQISGGEEGGGGR